MYVVEDIALSVSHSINCVPVAGSGVIDPGVYRPQSNHRSMETEEDCEWQTCEARIT